MDAVEPVLLLELAGAPRQPPAGLGEVTVPDRQHLHQPEHASTCAREVAVTGRLAVEPSEGFDALAVATEEVRGHGQLFKVRPRERLGAISLGRSAPYASDQAQRS